MSEMNHRKSRAWKCFLLLLFIHKIGGFSLPSEYPRLSSSAVSKCNSRFSFSRSRTTTYFGAATSDETKVDETRCFWRFPDTRQWLERKNLKDLEVGQKLTGYLVEELLDGKTGPKVYFECGVGRTNSRGEWSIVTGMLRMERSKQSVARKRASRLRKISIVDLYVSRIQLGCGRLEVCMKEEEVAKYTSAPPKINVASLKVGQEVTGTVVQLRPYGVMVDVGANRQGLLHIKSVAKLYGKYIDKEKGLEQAGLERGAKVRLAVAALEKRRLELDFTDDVKEEAGVGEQSSSVDSDPDVQEESTGMSAEELAEWAAYASGDAAEETPTDTVELVSRSAYDDDDDDDDEEEYDGYDEERDIEDSLGLGFY